MKIVLMLLLVGLVQGQVDDRWVLVAVDVKGGRHYVEYRYRENNAAGLKEVWTRALLKNGKSIKTLYECDCGQQKYRFLQATEYDQNGNVTTSISDAPMAMERVVPDSISEKIVTVICSSNFPYNLPNVALPEPVQKKPSQGKSVKAPAQKKSKK